MPPIKHTIDFHNPLSSKAIIDIIIRPNGFSSGKIGLLLPRVTVARREVRQLGVSVTRLAKDDPVGTWYTPVSDEAHRKLAESLMQKRFQACDRTHIFEFDTSMTDTALRGIEVDANQTLRAILVATLNSDVYLTGPARFDVIQLLDGKVAGGSTFQFGYELPAPGTVLPCRRIRITADSIDWREWGKCGHGHTGCYIILVDRVVLDDDPDRTYGRVIQERSHEYGHEQGREKKDNDGRREPEDRGTVLFDGIVQEGDSLTLSFISIHSHKAARSEEELFIRQFDGKKGIRSWLGEYGGRGKEGLAVKFGVDEMQMGGGGGEAD